MENNLRKLVKNYQKTLKIACGAILMKESAFGALFRFLKHWTTHICMVLVTSYMIPNWCGISYGSR